MTASRTLSIQSRANLTAAANWLKFSRGKKTKKQKTDVFLSFGKFTAMALGLKRN